MLIEKMAVVADLHLDGVGPRTRVDNFAQTSLDKLEKLRLLLLAEKCSVLVILGDVFHRHRQAINYLNRIIRVFGEFQSSGIQVFSIIGNHDISYERLDTLEDAPLCSLLYSGVVKELRYEEFDTPCGKVSLTGVHYPESLEPASGSCPIEICAAHRFYQYSYDPYSLQSDELVSCGYDVYLLGHDHVYHPPSTLGKRLIVRPGSFMRGTSHQFNLERQVYVCVLGFGGSLGRPQLRVSSKSLEVKPASEVFSSSVFHKDDSVSALVPILSTQLDQLLVKMEDVTRGRSIYPVFDAMEMPEEVRQRIESYLQAHGIYRG